MNFVPFSFNQSYEGAEINTTVNRLSLQCIIELAHSVLLHRRHDMTVNVHRHTDLVMTQQFLHHLRMHSHAQQDTGCTVSEVVEADLRQPGFLE